MILMKGSKNEYVRLLQKKLNIKVDGDYGKNTRHAVIQFQRKVGILADGVVGKDTLAALDLSFSQNHSKKITPSLAEISNNTTTESYITGEDVDKLYQAIRPLFRVDNTKNNKRIDDQLYKGLVEITKYNKEFHLESVSELALFFGQIRQEVSAKFITKENLNYSCKVLASGYPFSYFGKHPNLARKYGRCSGHPANQEKIAYYAYGHGKLAKNLGNLSPEDGARFVGRGAKQTTGRYNYQVLQNWINKKLPQVDWNVMKNPELLEQSGLSLISAAVFWASTHAYKAASFGVSKKSSDYVTTKVNKGTSSLSYRQRWKFTKQVARQLKVMS